MSSTANFLCIASQDCIPLPQLSDSFILDIAIVIDAQQELTQVRCTLTALQLIALQESIQHVGSPLEFCCQTSYLVRICCICITATIIPLQAAKKVRLHTWLQDAASQTTAKHHTQQDSILYFSSHVPVLLCRLNALHQFSLLRHRVNTAGVCSMTPC